LQKTSLIIRLAAIGAVLAGIAGLFAYAGGWLTPGTLTPASMIDTFEKVGGLHPGFRRNHAKGVCISGYFNSNGRGVALSKAAIFPSGRVPVIGRFALAGGQPYVTDAQHGDPIQTAGWRRVAHGHEQHSRFSLSKPPRDFTISC
jgi:catalase